jgi:Protein of unknown function (DUF2750)
VIRNLTRAARAVILHAPRIPELAQRDRFVKRAIKEGCVFTLADEETACVPSQKIEGRTVQLFWSCPKEAKRWAEALTGEGALQEIPLDEFAADILPGIKAGRGFAGADWVADPIEAEVEPADLILRLKHEAVTAFLAHLSERGEVFLAEADEGPLLLPIMRRGIECQALYIFAARADAERVLKRIVPGRRIVSDPIADFASSTLPWLASRHHHVVFEPIPRAGTLELEASDIAARLKRLAVAA